ncbi:MAG: uroporphyrinogen-III C-methyltransferase [Alphaproteobacteria bacterium]|nr:uroporphyrinogen-III C-methyltransferase [Alphaproteobacteria bacterium]
MTDKAKYDSNPQGTDLDQPQRPGRVDLIGCGPGDPELLTLRALKRLAMADVVVADRLVPDAIVELADAKARRIDVGKTPFAPSISQDEINQILVREALKGNHVARLKGGDPGIFGRLAEEVSALRAAGVSVDIVPGVTAAHACAAEIGLPVTLRHKVRQFSVLTGATAGGTVDLDWQALSREGHAFAIYMGVAAADTLAKRMLESGAAPTLPVVVVENGCRLEQRSVQTTLAQLSEAITALAITGPAIIFVGLDWQQANLSRPTTVESFPATQSASIEVPARAAENADTVVTACPSPNPIKRTNVS